jgi:hypothetical protein
MLGGVLPVASGHPNGQRHGTGLDRRSPRRVWELDNLRNRFGIGKQA